MGGYLTMRAVLCFPLIAAFVNAALTYVKMTLQRRWRTWLNAHALDQWLTGGRCYQLNLVPGDHSNPEYRVADSSPSARIFKPLRQKLRGRPLSPGP